MAEQAPRLVYMNGEFVHECDAKVSIYDSAMMFGDMVFEMTRSFNGKQFRLREHVDRMYRGIKQLQIPIKETPEEMEQLVYKTMEANQPSFTETDEHRILINVSRGPLSAYKMVFDGKLEPTVCIADFPVKWTVSALAHYFDDGVHAVTPRQPAIPAQFLEPKIKNRSRMHYQVANLEVSLVSDPNAWALLVDPDGFVAEGTGSNFFIVDNGVVKTPEPRNVLRGTRRAFILELCGRLGIPAKECNIELYDVAHAQEAFFTSTAFSMLPCFKINGITIGDGRRGPVFGKLLAAWNEEVGLDIEKQTREFAGEVGDILSGGTTMYRFSK